MRFTELLKQPEIQHFFESIDHEKDILVVRKYAEKLVPSIYRDKIPQLCALHFLRNKAKEKFSEASRMCFTQRGLEQSTSEAIADYKMRFVDEESRVLILCSGIGGELLAAGKKTRHLAAVDNDPEIMHVAECNVQELLAPSSPMRYHVMLVEEYMQTVAEDAFTHIFVDPDRRDTKRHVSLHAYAPNIIPLLPALLRSAPHVYCKVAPGIAHEELYDLPYLSKVEYIEDTKGLKECLLHFERNPQTPVVVACTHVDRGKYFSITYPFVHESSQSEFSGTYYRYLFEPTPALIRSGAIPLFYKDHGLVQREASCAYGYTNLPDPETMQWGSYFEILAEIPFSQKQFKSYITKEHIHSCIIKKRYFPMEPQEIRRLVKIPEGGQDIFIATTIQNKKVLLHCRYILEEKHIST